MSASSLVKPSRRANTGSPSSSCQNTHPNSTTSRSSGTISRRTIWHIRPSPMPTPQQRNPRSRGCPEPGANCQSVGHSKDLFLKPRDLSSGRHAPAKKRMARPVSGGKGPPVKARTNGNPCRQQSLLPHPHTRPRAVRELHPAPMVRLVVRSGARLSAGAATSCDALRSRRLHVQFNVVKCGALKRALVAPVPVN